MKLENKTVIVTGGAMGIGKACCEGFAAEGANVVLIDWDDMGKDTAAKIGERCMFIKADISDEDQIHEVKEEIMRKYGRIDVLVNNAAIQTENSFFKMSAAEFRKVIDVNLIGTFICSSTFGSEMKRGSTVVNMLSVHYDVPRLNKFHYDAAKAGMAIMTKEMALAVADKGITVNGVSYGACRTPMNRGWETSPESRLAAEKKIPLRWIAEPEEIAHFVTVVVKEFSKHATGSIFTYDGGRSI